MSDHLKPRVATEQPEPTGSLLISFREDCDLGAPAAKLEQIMGRAPARSSDYRMHVMDLAETLHNDGAAVFDEFRLAVVDPGVCGFETNMFEGIAEDTDVVSVRPEYRMEASNLLLRMVGLRRQNDGGWGYDTPEMEEPEPQPAPQPQPEPTPENPSRPTTWGLRAVMADRSGFGGAGVKVAILDTGLDFEHPDYAGRAIISESFVSGETAQDGQGHGTHVAGTAVGLRMPRADLNAPRYGVAPDADLFVGKVLGDNGSGREGDILAGILWALQNECDIISMSLGRRPIPGDATGDYDRVGRIALEQGSLIIAAAGNESNRSFGRIAPVGAPANARAVLAVAALDEAFDIADFSNGGLEADGGAIDIAAPGVDIFSAIPGGDYARFAGTSMAAPHVAGVAALLAQSNPSLRGQALWDALTAGARRLELPARDIGAGLAQAPVDVGVV
ncbi:MAG: S8 family serine peptidase [Rhodobacteraceae bacterium]|nr:S8 family serine peptidase [Paracoccaceae bacterium]